jgi:anti-sigma regulatory factor (Ser/Thr protein kinase)
MRSETTRATFPAEPTAPRQARHLVEDLLRSRGFNGTATDAALLVSELATNAVLHAYAPFALTVNLDDERVRVEITDPADALPLSPVLRPDVGGGQGIRIVGAIADRWGVEPNPNGGKTVWFELH